MADVARAAGVSRQTLYYEFGSKDALAQALTMREAQRYIDGSEAAYAAHEGSPAAAPTRSPATSPTSSDACCRPRETPHEHPRPVHDPGGARDVGRRDAGRVPLHVGVRRRARPAAVAVPEGQGQAVGPGAPH